MTANAIDPGRRKSTARPGIARNPTDEKRTSTTIGRTAVARSVSPRRSASRSSEPAIASVAAGTLAARRLGAGEDLDVALLERGGSGTQLGEEEPACLAPAGERGDDRGRGRRAVEPIPSAALGRDRAQQGGQRREVGGRE